MYHDWDWAGAEREFRLAIALNPGYSTRHQWYGNYLSVLGRFDESVTEFSRAIALDPLALPMIVTDRRCSYLTISRTSPAAAITLSTSRESALAC